MPEHILFPNFRDQQEFSRYPFRDNASLTTQLGDLAIEVNTFIDASLYPIGGGARMYIRTIDITPRDVTINISDEDNATLASVTFDVFDPPDILRLTDSRGRPAGMLLSEPLRLALFSSWEVGTHTFELGDTEFVATVAIPTPEIGVRGILTENNELLTGDVWIVGENGVVVREEDGHIRVDIVGDSLFRRRICGPVDLFNVPLFIKTINGCGPDEFGNFALPVGGDFTEDTVLRIYPVDGGLKIEAVGRLVRDL